MSTKAPQGKPTPETPAPEAPITTEVVAPKTGNPLTGMFDFAQLVDTVADEVRGFRLIDQSALEAIPFVVVGINVRDGVKRMSDKGVVPTNYLSVECVTADEITLTRLIKQQAISQGGNIVRSLDDLAIRPNECVVFNDGSTGVARSLVSFLHLRGFVDIGDTSKPNGPMGESSFDRYHGDWVRGGRDVGDDTAPDPAYYGEPMLKCMRGLRSSAYKAEATNADAETWYLG